MENIKIVLISFFFLILSFYSVQSQSQIIVPGSEELLDKLRLNKSIDGPEEVLYSNMVGDPYLFKDFHQGKMTLNSGETYQLDLRFDIYANQMHMKYKDQVYAIIHQEKIASLIIGTEQFIYSNYLKSTDSELSPESTYFILGTDGKCKLLIKKNIRIQDAELPKVLQDAKPARFIRTNDTYYLKMDNNPAVKINSKNDLLSVLSDHNENISQFINNNKIGTKKIEDLKKIITYYNSL